MLYNSGTGKAGFSVTDAASGVDTHTATSNLTDSLSHRLVVTNASGTLAMYLDGIATGSLNVNTGTGNITTQPATLHIGNRAAGTIQAHGLMSNMVGDSTLAGCN